MDFISARMNNILNTGNSELDQMLSYLLSEPGKMLRPRLVFLASSLYPSDQNVVQDGAVALELIHLASLVHDDVVDGSLLRRGKASVYQRWGSKASVLLGDYLFATAFRLINQHNIPAILDTVTRTIQIMCSGEIEQLSSSFAVDWYCPITWSESTAKPPVYLNAAAGWVLWLPVCLPNRGMICKGME